MFFKELTPEEDWIAKWQYGYLGHFHKALFEAICVADEENLDKLSPGFPDEISGYRKYTRQAGWWKEVQKKIGRSVAKIEKEKEVSNHTHKCKGCEEIVDDLDFNCELGLCCYCLNMMKEEEKEKE